MPKRKSTSLVRRAPLPPRRVRTTVDPSRLAVAAFERIESLLVRLGQHQLLTPALSALELAARRDAVGCALPASYLALAKLTGGFGAPEVFLDAAQIAEKSEELRRRGASDARYRVFATSEEKSICFDTKSASADGELVVVQWGRNSPMPLARSFGEWLDLVADEREARLEQASTIPSRLRELLVLLGFAFDATAVGRLRTADTDALERLLGPERVAALRVGHGRLTDATGKALLSLNLDDFSMTARVASGIVELADEEVFRWLRTFRDENFFAPEQTRPGAPQGAPRDLRYAPREPESIVRGRTELLALSASRHYFLDASGRASNDFYLLGRVHGNSQSLLLHLEHDAVTTARRIDDSLDAIAVAPQGHLWALTQTHAIRFDGSHSERYPLARPTPGRTIWNGISVAGSRVLVWGQGALLEFDGQGFVPFREEMHLDPQETILSLQACRDRISALVAQSGVGAVAHFDGKQWLQVHENAVVEGDLVGAATFGDADYVMDGRGTLNVVRAERVEKRPWDPRRPALRGDDGTLRSVRGLLIDDAGDFLFSVDGGVVVRRANQEEPVFYAAARSGTARVVRVGPPAKLGAADFFHDEGASAAAILVGGGGAWIWREQAFDAIDLRAW